MSLGPVSGGGIAVSLTQGTVFWTVTSQAAWDQFVQLKDPSGNVVFTATGASPDVHSPTQIGQGSFASEDGDYQLFVGINGGQSWSSVIYDYVPVSVDGRILSSSFAFISEDGADQDYNDSCTTLSWFEYKG